ncbi:unnamed protein product [Soboliphyme baturini]|uniref:BHLH domain-containing protein n=1 Tax=Soboliphyme baturini TaxID=241478 RepID=A0A183IN58_9BILA|nr:unnamed protein product [Soboliphyme baturini]
MCDIDNEHYVERFCCAPTSWSIMNDYQHFNCEETFDFTANRAHTNNDFDFIETEALPQHLALPYRIPWNFDEQMGCDDADWQKSVRKRIASISRERRRNAAINVAFQKLQGAIPHTPNGRAVAKIRTLRLAIRYIQYLKQQLATDVKNDVGERCGEEVEKSINDFTSIAEFELNRKNSYAIKARHFWTPLPVKKEFY